LSFGVLANPFLGVVATCSFGVFVKLSGYGACYSILGTEIFFRSKEEAVFNSFAD